MIAVLIEVTLLLALAGVFDRLTVARLRPQVRHALWTLVAIRLLLPGGLPGVAPATLAIDASQVPVATTFESVSAVWIAGAWALGAAVLLARWSWLARLAGRRLQPLEPATDPKAEALVAHARGIADRIGLLHVPEIRIDPAADSAYVTGLWRPRLVIPAGWRGWPALALDHAIAHELAHIVRRDIQAEALWMLITCAYWFHPLVHAARRRAHEAREMCCDTDVAAHLGPGYRLTLLQVLAASVGEAAPHRIAPSAHAWHPAIARLHALDRWPRPAPRRHRLGAAALVLAAGVIVLPAHVSVIPRIAPVEIRELLDPATRQERGMGSLHLRYALLAAEAERAGRETE